jgi:hypothetical protein
MGNLGYRAGKLFFDMNRNPQLHARYQADREAVMAEYRLPEDEKQAIRDGNTIALYEMGINPYLMVGSARFLGIGNDMRSLVTDFTKSLEGAGPSPVIDSVANPGPPKNGKWLIRDEDLPARWQGAVKK